MTKADLLVELQALTKGGDASENHASADTLLLDFINDPDIMIAYEAIKPKWYA